MRPPLRVATPDEWVEEAIRRWPELVADHANCEKKAASTALALMFAYPEDRALVAKLSKLAREELRHFEQVDKLMQAHAVPYSRRKPGRYASALREAVRTHEPYRKLDLLLCGALIEARSCERFSLLSSRSAGGSLPTDIVALYEGLQASEARHCEPYLKLAEAHVNAHPECERQKSWSVRLEELATLEADLATSTDAEFRFHSGLPQG